MFTNIQRNILKNTTNISKYIFFKCRKKIIKIIHKKMLQIFLKKFKNISKNV